MKIFRVFRVFRVVTERDGLDHKNPGISSTEIVQSDYRYAAHTMERVWQEISLGGLPADETVVAIIEEQPAIIILDFKQTERIL